MRAFVQTAVNDDGAHAKTRNLNALYIKSTTDELPIYPSLSITERMVTWPPR